MRRLAAAILAAAWLAAGLAAREPPEPPRLGIGPARELLLLGDDERTTARAMRWADWLDAVETAYRRSSPDLDRAERRGALRVGRVGGCSILSVPVDGKAESWSGLRTEQGAPIRRHLRFVDGAGDCGGYGLDLSLFPTPRQEAFGAPFSLVLTDLELPRLSFLDLEPTPRAPAVRTLARSPQTAREAINVASWPAATVRGVDLCRAPFMDTLCLRDLRIRQQLATAATGDPAVAGPLVDGCREFFDRLRSVPSPHPCTDPGAWRKVVGAYRTGYLGEMVLRDRPRLVSRVDEAGDVQWLWSESPPSGRIADFPLADGTRVALAMPRAEPPRFAAPPTPLTQRRDRPPASAPEAGKDGGAPATEDAASPLTVGEVETASADVTTHSAPPAIVARDPVPPPNVTNRKQVTGPATDPVAATPAGAPDPSLSRPASPAARSPAAARPPAPGAGTPAAPRRLLWPIVLGALTMTVAVALLLRGHRASARVWRRTLSAGPVLDQAAPVLLLAADAPAAKPPPTSSERDDPAPEIAPAAGPRPRPAALPPAPPADVVPLDPPELCDPPASASADPRPPLAREFGALEAGERRGISRSLTAITRLAEWVACLSSVLDQVERGRRALPALDRLPVPARREWRSAQRALRRFTEVEAAACHRLLQGFDGRPSTPDDEAQTRYLSEAGLLDQERGTLPQRLRRHLLRPGTGRLQAPALGVQYLIEAYPVEHLQKAERRTYLTAVRDRLQEKGLSTKFHRLIDESATGLGLRYRSARYYQHRIDERDAYDVFDLSERVGYPAATDRGIVVRLRELFLSETATGEPYSGRALIDRGS